MGCLLNCFGASKSKLFNRRRNLVAATVTPFKEQQQEHEDDNQAQISQLLTQLSIEIENPIVESIENPLDCCSEEKETLDLNVKTNYEEVSEEEFTFADISVQNNEIQVEEDTDTPEIACCSANHELEQSESIDPDSPDEGHCNNEFSGDKFLVLEDTSESLFSLSIDSRKQRCEPDNENEVSSPFPKSVSINEQKQPDGSKENNSVPSQNVDSVSENSTQLKPPPLKEQDKENVSVEPSFKEFTHNKSRLNSRNDKLADQEIAVDTSLSSWLVKSEATCSPSSGGNSAARSASSARLVLGELTAEEVNTSPRLLSVTPSFDKRPVTGTVGSYWSRTGQAVDSD